MVCFVNLSSCLTYRPSELGQLLRTPDKKRYDDDEYNEPLVFCQVIRRSGVCLDHDDNDLGTESTYVGFAVLSV
jgi:hypothetical protein